MASSPRKILRLPSMCAMTNPTRTTPVTAITTFLPTMVPQSTTTGLLDQKPARLRCRRRPLSLGHFFADDLLLPYVLSS